MKWHHHDVFPSALQVLCSGRNALIYWQVICFLFIYWQGLGMPNGYRNNFDRRVSFRTMWQVSHLHKLLDMHELATYVAAIYTDNDECDSFGFLFYSQNSSFSFSSIKTSLTKKGCMIFKRNIIRNCRRFLFNKALCALSNT